MSVTQDDIQKAINDSWVLAVEYPPELQQWLSIDGVRMRYSETVANGMLNTAGSATLTADNADSTIETIQAHVNTLGHSMSWFWSDSDTPSDLNVRLERAGFISLMDLWGMVRNDLHHEIAINPKVRVREAKADDRNHVKHIYQYGADTPEDVLDPLMDLYDYMGTRHYLAYIEHYTEPVSVASMVYYPHKPIAVLLGATTLKEFRGNGIYTALMAKRLDDARADGMEVAVLQADITTSAPICAKLDFEKVNDLRLYVYQAPNIGQA